MILVDTSVWVNHFRSGSVSLQTLLAEGRVLMHPFVIGEVACGQLRRRSEILGWLQSLPAAVVADQEEVLQLLGNRHFFGIGLGWVDVHLLASVLLTGCRLWTVDRALREASERLRVSYWPNS